MKGVRQHYSASPRLCLGGDERGTYARDEAMLRIVNNSITHALSCPEGHSAKSIGTTGEESSQASDLQVSFCASALMLFFFFKSMSLCISSTQTNTLPLMLMLRLGSVCASVSQQ